MSNELSIKSFEVNHNTLTEGIYVSRCDGDITTFDMRMRVPNSGDYMSNLAMHSFEHMFATYIRNSDIGDSVIYFGPMGCQTGFYLLTRNLTNDKVLSSVFTTLERIITHTGEIFGADPRQCGNYRNLSLDVAKDEASRYLALLKSKDNDFLYKD